MVQVPKSLPVRHATVVTEHSYEATAEEVFNAWADPIAYMEWHVPGDGWTINECIREFTVGGRDYSRFGPPGSPKHHSDGRFEIIIPNSRIVSMGTMYCERIATSSTLCTVQIFQTASGSDVVVTDQSAYFDERASPEERAQGWTKILAKLARVLGAPSY